MHLRIALDFNRNIFNILVCFQSPLPIQSGKFLGVDSWEWHLGGAWGDQSELGVAFMENTHSPELEQTAGLQQSGSWNPCPEAELTGARKREPPVLSPEAAIFTRLVGNGGPSLIMVNLSKPNGHSSHPVGNKHPQVKLYEVLKRAL